MFSVKINRQQTCCVGNSYNFIALLKDGAARRHTIGSNQFPSSLVESHHCIPITEHRLPRTIMIKYRIFKAYLVIQKIKNTKNMVTKVLNWQKRREHWSQVSGEYREVREDDKISQTLEKYLGYSLFTLLKTSNNLEYNLFMPI